MSTLEISIAAEADDGYLYPTTDSFFDSTGVQAILGSDDPGGGAREAAGWFRFVVPIPNSADISTAYMKSYVNSCGAGVHLKIYAEDQDNPAATSDAADFFAATLTTAAVDWDPASTDITGVFNGPEIKTVIQEIVDRAGWASGNAIQLMVRNDASTADRKIVIATYESASQEPRLYIEYISGGQVIMWTSE